MRTPPARIPLTLAVLGLCAAAGCGGTEPRDETKQTVGANTSSAVSILPGTLVGGDPVVLSERPVDLAILGAGEVANRVIVPSMDKSNGRQDILWAPREAGSEEEQPYWTSGAPSWLELKLAEPAYISEVILYPLSQGYGLGEFSLQIVTGGQIVDAFPPVAVAAPPMADPDYDGPAPSLIARFQPKLAEKLRFQFTKGGPAAEDQVFLKRIRVLGIPSGPGILRSEVALAEERSGDFQRSRVNVAEFRAADVRGHVRLSEDGTPNGNPAAPWVNEAQRGGIASYWSATSPAWVEVDFGRDCYIDEVTVRPYSASHGLKSFYAKIVDDSGREHDTWPPARASSPDPAEDSAQLLAARFDPVFTRRLRIYIDAGESVSKRAYIRKISVMGAPAESL